MSDKQPHPKTEDCPDPECLICGERDCPFHEPLHYHHDGCPECSPYQNVIYAAIALAFNAEEVTVSEVVTATNNVIYELAKKGLLKHAQ